MVEVKWNYPTIDPWQEAVLAFVGNMILMCGRQIGKSEIVAKKIADYLLANPKHKLLIVSGVERQASGLYQKVVYYLEGVSKKKGKKSYADIFKERPLRTKFILKNGSQLITEPVGNDGSGARQHTVNGVIFEEMQLIPEEAFAAISPMMLTTGGFIWMLGTAWSTEGYVYERLSDENFEVFRINAEEVANIRPEPQRTIMLKYLENERVRLTEAQYQQEYLAIPSDKTRQIFPDKLIAKIMNANRPNAINQAFDYVCGVDPSGLGADEGSISIFKYNEDVETLTQTDHIITTKLYTTQTTERIVSLEKQYDFNKIYVDDGGVGFGVFSELLNEDETKFKTIPLNNASRPLDYKDEKRKTIFYENMIFNLLNQMEKAKISLLQDPEIRESLKSYKFEYSKDKKLLISSNYNHPVQSIMRAAWHLQSKNLKLQVHSIKV